MFIPYQLAAFQDKHIFSITIIIFKFYFKIHFPWNTKHQHDNRRLILQEHFLLNIINVAENQICEITICWLSYVANRDKLLNNIFLLWFVACAWTRKTSNRKITSVVIFLQTNFKYQNRLLKKPMGNKIIYYYFEPDIHTLQPFYLLHVNNIWIFLSLRQSSENFECVDKVTFFNSFIDTKWSPIQH